MEAMVCHVFFNKKLLNVCLCVTVRECTRNWQQQNPWATCWLREMVGWRLTFQGLPFYNFQILFHCIYYLCKNK